MRCLAAVERCLAAVDTGSCASSSSAEPYDDAEGSAEVPALHQNNSLTIFRSHDLSR
jgi:hypothetical protein